jgi:hypothetical protein
MGLLAGKRILVTGLVSNRSIAYGIVQACKREGAESAFIYVGERFKERIAEFAIEFGSDLVFPCDDADDAQIDTLFVSFNERWDGLDGLIHSIGFAPREAIIGARPGRCTAWKPCAPNNKNRLFQAVFCICDVHANRVLPLNAGHDGRNDCGHSRRGPEGDGDTNHRAPNSGGHPSNGRHASRSRSTGRRSTREPVDRPRAAEAAEAVRKSAPAQRRPARECRY